MNQKSLVKNSFYYIVYRLINVIYPLITITYVSRILEPEGVGAISLAQTVVTFLVACALLRHTKLWCSRNKQNEQR